MSRPQLADAFEHHVWATNRLLETCIALTPEQLATTVPGTYGSILDTMRHLVGSDAAYLFVLTNERISLIDEDAMDLRALHAAMEGFGPEWTALIAAESDPETIVVRHRDDGSESCAPLGVRLAQAIHHGTDHRSRICTALTTLGIEPPEIDAWSFAEAGGRLELRSAPVTSHQA